MNTVCNFKYNVSIKNGEEFMKEKIVSLYTKLK